MILTGILCAAEDKHLDYACYKKPYTTYVSYIVAFLSPLLFFLVGYAILKDFHTCLAENSLVENSIGDVMTIDQWNSE